LPVDQVEHENADLNQHQQGEKMGEWSDYFEDFPDENPANYVGERFDPQGAARIREQSAKVAADQKRLNDEIQQIVKLHKSPPSP
jgi:hypothetical protein